MDIQQHESEAALEAGKLAGEYLESINKFDLSKLTKEEWRIFCEVICINFQMIVTPF